MKKNIIDKIAENTGETSLKYNFTNTIQKVQAFCLVSASGWLHFCQTGKV